MARINIDWPISEKTAIQDQTRLRRQLRLGALPLNSVRNCLAVGVAYSENRKAAIATGVPMLLTGHPASDDPPFVVEVPNDFPYRAGLFVYREGPAVVSLLNSLPPFLGLLIVYGQGVAHPRGFGMASHIGVLASVPSIGITRKRLWGRGPEPALDSTEVVLLRDKLGTPIGLTRRMEPGGNPLFASAGHLTDIPTVQEFLSSCLSIRGGLPSALCVAQEAANKRAFN